MKVILNLLIILSFILLPLSPFSQEAANSTLLASVEYLDRQPPVEKKARQGIFNKLKAKKKKKRHRKRFKHQFKKQEEDNDKKGLSTSFFIIAGVLLAGLIAWGIYFFPLLASGGLASSAGCLAPLFVLVLGFLGVLFSLILVAGAIIFTIFAIKIITQNSSKNTQKAKTSSENKKQIEKDDFIKIQIQDKASKDFPSLAPETLEKYVNVKDSIVELKYERSKLEAIEARGPINARVQEKIERINARITEKEIIIDAIEKSHDDLEQLPDHKRAPYCDIRIKLAALRAKQRKYQRENDLRSIAKLRDVEDAIQEQEEELKLLLGINKD